MGLLEKNKTLRENWWKFALVLGWIVIAFPLALVITGRAFLGFIFGLAPILLYVLFRYIYVRVFQPFTTKLPSAASVVHENSQRDLENNGSEAEKRCCAWSKSEIIATVLFMCLVVLSIVPLFLSESLVGTEPNKFMVFGYNFFGSLLILIVCITLVDFADIAKGAYLLFSKQATELQFSQTAKERRIKAVISLLLYVICVSVSLSRSYGAPLVEELEIISPKIPGCLNGYKILLITDLHAGPLAGREEIQRLVTQVNGLEPDLILLGGDFADGPPNKVGPATTPLKSLQATHGTFYVVGNHEYLHGSTGAEWNNYMVSENGIQSLNNTFQLVGNQTTVCTGFNIVGVDDFSMGKPNLTQAIQGLDSSLFTLLLAHQPNQSRDAAKTEVIDFQLSGHTHHGSIWPIHGLSYAGNTHFAGLESENDKMIVYTSSGSVGWGPRTRFLSQNNIDLITLKNGQALSQPDGIHYTIVWSWLAFPYIVLSVLFCIFFQCPCFRRNTKVK